MKRGLKNGQMQISFGMIFSIFLIIAFLAFAGYAIVKLLDFQCTAKMGTFINDFKSDVDRIWTGGGGSQRVQYPICSKVKEVCFVSELPAKGISEVKEKYEEKLNFYQGTGNMFILPVGAVGKISEQNIPHIEIEKTTEEENPLCIKSNKGKVSMLIKMSAGESLVTVSR